MIFFLCDVKVKSVFNFLNSIFYFDLFVNVIVDCILIVQPKRPARHETGKGDLLEVLTNNILMLKLMKNY